MVKIWYVKLLLSRAKRTPPGWPKDAVFWGWLARATHQVVKNFQSNSFWRNLSQPLYHLTPSPLSITCRGVTSLSLFKNNCQGFSLFFTLIFNFFLIITAAGLMFSNTACYCLIQLAACPQLSCFITSSSWDMRGT